MSCRLFLHLPELPSWDLQLHVPPPCAPLLSGQAPFLVLCSSRIITIINCRPLAQHQSMKVKRTSRGGGCMLPWNLKQPCGASDSNANSSFTQLQAKHMPFLLLTAKQTEKQTKTEYFPVYQFIQIPFSSGRTFNS